MRFFLLFNPRIIIVLYKRAQNGQKHVPTPGLAVKYGNMWLALIAYHSRYSDIVILRSYLWRRLDTYKYIDDPP